MRTAEQIAADAENRRAFSNGSEYEYWADSGRGCYDCTQDDPNTEKYCPILGVALLGQWPKEWARRTVESRYGSYEAVGECAEFDERRDDGEPDDDSPDPDPGPPPAVEGQIDMFEVFAERIADEATAVRPAEVAR